MPSPYDAPTDVVDGRCPECGVDLKDKRVNVRKHVIMHYGSEPLPVVPNTYVARARQAAILGRPKPEE